MLQLLARYKGIIVVGVLLAMPLVLLYAQTKKPGARGPVVGVFVDVAALIERGLLWSVGGILDGFHHYVTSVGTYDELVRLRRDENSTAQAQARIGELEAENEELRSLAREVERIDGPRAISGRVVARTGAPLTRIFTLDVGTSDGVRRGDGVVDKHGVVGLVLAVGRRSCDVLLLTDSSSALDVVDQRTRARGIVRGEGSDERYGAKVEDFDKLRDVQPGDLIVTSGLGARFPPGVLVGTVVDAEAPDDSLYLRAVIRPAAELARVEHVAVLIDRPPPPAPRLGGREEEEVVDAGPAPLTPLKPGPKPPAGAPLPPAPAAGPAGAASPPTEPPPATTTPSTTPAATGTPPATTAAPPSTTPAPPSTTPAPPSTTAAPPSTPPSTTPATPAKPGAATPPPPAKPGAAATTPSKPGATTTAPAKPGATTSTTPSKPGATTTTTPAKPGAAPATMAPTPAKPGAATTTTPAKPGAAATTAPAKPGAATTTAPAAADATTPAKGKGKAKAKPGAAAPTTTPPTPAPAPKPGAQ